MATFENLFPTFLQKCAELHELLRIVAFMLFIVGTILFVVHGFSGKTLMLHMVRLFILTALLVFLPQWGNQVQSLVQNSILSGLGVDPSNVQDQYNQLLVVKRDTTSGSHSWWDILGDIRSFTEGGGDLLRIAERIGGPITHRRSSASGRKTPKDAKACR